MGWFLGQYREISWVSCFYDTSCCFCDTSCCFYDTSMILLVKEREKCHFGNALSISFITYYCKSEMRLWYFFREKISFVCKILSIYEPCLSVIYSSYPYDFFIQLHASYMLVTCVRHCFKGLLLCFRAILSRPVTCQLHELCPSDGSNSRERPKIAK